MFTIHIVGLVNGDSSEFDNKYVKEYDPAYFHQDGYDGGLLDVCDTAAEAKQFADIKDAMTYYRQSYGTRRDGLPNRPLTAWSVEFEEKL